ncbi:type VI secretion system baseplate subunit TssG [Enterobacter sp. Ap-916]|uniref:type VI secretion system baseplate subunit TssG n=1 Tax=Enterobacteriaceae TaxID=543 RepID=UPI000272AB60|nr:MULTISPECIES: type VI secretion system baseplate subunit TssG [unclassified Enterobacter]EJF32573.1 T6SS protein Cts1R [Enterobacter sp. Ag1]NIF33044.1 type VI secretion system baseplate subunit TssG [Enterobacter sp. Cy-643]NIF59314.1 type VI secretion system baseplate subunit TssG [Enterobacter sp. Ap-867]NIG30960.1 type VI secretion system baseplate subunit TssG [Enterobacter sp. Ap-916]
MTLPKLPQASSLPPGLENWFDPSAPWDAGFISIMRAIAARTPSLPPPGKAALPSQERFRLGQISSMAFSPREIAAIHQQDDKIKLQLFGLGIWGAQGAMPLHLSELAYSRYEQHDPTLIDFVDIFHHRALSQFYRAWFLSQDTASLDRKEDERFSFYVGSLVGLDPSELDPAPLPIHARLASSAHLIREARNPDGLLGAMEYYFQVPVQMEEFELQWIFLEGKDQTALGDDRYAALLGDGAILGNTVLDRQHKFKLMMGPLTLAQYMLFSPWGSDMAVLRELVRSFIGFEYAWDVQLVLAADQVPRATLDGSHQLGYASWLEREASETPVFGMSFEPEMYRR